MLEKTLVFLSWKKTMIIWVICLLSSYLYIEKIIDENLLVLIQWIMTIIWGSASVLTKNYYDNLQNLKK